MKLQPETCYYITASTLANEFYELEMDAAGDAIESLVGSADLASAVEGEIGRAMVTARQLIKMLKAENEPELVETISKTLDGLSLFDDEVYIDIYN